MQFLGICFKYAALVFSDEFLEHVSIGRPFKSECTRVIAVPSRRTFSSLSQIDLILFHWRYYSLWRWAKGIEYSSTSLKNRIWIRDMFSNFMGKLSVGIIILISLYFFLKLADCVVYYILFLLFFFCSLSADTLNDLLQNIYAYLVYKFSSRTFSL